MKEKKIGDSKWGHKVKEPKAMQLIKIKAVKLKIDEVVSHVKRSIQN